MAFPKTLPDDQVETIVFNGYRYRRYPKSKNEVHKNYFGRSGAFLHRDVWEFHNGPIPKGYEVHHKDENTLNNDPSNLEAITISEHRSFPHSKKIEYQTSGKMHAHLESIRELTKAWHKSPEGRKWHSDNAKESHQRLLAAGKPGLGAYERKPVNLVCIWCGAGFVALTVRAKFCTPVCQNRESKYRRSGYGEAPESYRRRV